MASQLSQDELTPYSGTPAAAAQDDALFQGDYEFGALQTSLAKVQTAWIAERSAPELLNFEMESVTDLQTRIKERQDELDELTEQGVSNAMMLHIYQMDVDRANFVLASYLRTRLAKIEKYITYIMLPDSTDERQRLSPQEKRFAAAYSELVREHFHESFLNQLPEKYRNLNERGMVEQPNLTSTCLPLCRSPLSRWGLCVASRVLLCLFTLALALPQPLV